MQVAPAELETFLLLHPMVADVSVVPYPNEMAGELPRAYIVKSQAAKDLDDKVVKDQLNAYVNESFAQYKRLAGGIEFVESLPKTASGKTQRAIVKELAKAAAVASKRFAERRRTKAARPVIQRFDFSSDEDD